MRYTEKMIRHYYYNQTIVGPKWLNTPFLQTKNATTSGASAPITVSIINDPAPNINFKQQAFSAGNKPLYFNNHLDHIQLQTEDIFFDILDKNTIHIYPGAKPPETITHHFWQSALLAVLTLRGGISLHANAVRINHKVYLFIGDSGAGKSTFTSYLYQQGYQLISDDCSFLTLASDGQVLIHPGKQEIRLYQESCDLVGLPIQDAYRTVKKLDQIKYCFAIPSTTETSQLSGIILIKKGKKTALTTLKDIEKFQSILNSVFAFSQPNHVPNPTEQFKKLTHLIQATPAITLERSADQNTLEELKDLVISYSQKEIKK